MNNKTTIVIVIPTFNRGKYLKVILKQLYEQTFTITDINFSIVIVVDGSTDGTIEMIKEKFPKVHLVIGNGTWWYTKSMNEGFKYAKIFNPDYILTLNDDIKIQNDYLINLVEASKRVSVDSIIGSISFTESIPYKLIFSGVKKINWRGKLIRYHLMLSDIEPINHTGIYESVILTGRGMLIPFNILKELDYFDEKFIQYFSDMDFCLRARNKGYKSFICWDAKIYSFIKETATVTSFIKTPLLKFLKGFFNKYSRIYIPSLSRYTFRHGNKLLFPVILTLNLLAIFKAYFFNKKFT